MKKYLLLAKPMGKRIRIFFINREAFNNVVNKNIDVFKKVIAPEISAEKLLTQFQSENTNVSNILHNNEGLLGILLGFGKHNARLFQQKEDLLEKEDRLKKYGIYKLEPIQKELQLMNAKLQSLHEHDPYIIASINRVCFAADLEHYETLKLRNKYDELNIKINEIYSKADWLEQTLLQLISIGLTQNITI